MPRKAARANGHDLTADELINQVGAALLSSTEFQEVLTAGDLDLMREDVGWIKFGEAVSLEDESRTAIVKRARIHWHRDPLVKQAVRLYTDYAIGGGISYKVKAPETQKRVTQFWRLPANRAVLGPQGQRKSSNRLLVDGELPFLLFKDGAVPVVRRLDPLQICKVITHPDDEEQILLYKREFKRPSGRDKTVYYRHWAAQEEDFPRGLKDDGKDLTFASAEEDVVLYPVLLDPFGNRGNSLMNTVLDWSREHRRFIEARAAIMRALAKFAWKLKAEKGGQAALDALRAKIQTKLTASTPETNPPPAMGSTFLENSGLTLSALPRTTGGSEAKDDADTLKLQICAGTNIMLHYFGDPSTGNLATAEAMELPMLKTFTSYQNLWGEAYAGLIEAALDLEPAEDEAGVVDIDFPPILERDLGKLSTAIVALVGAVPQLKQPEVLQLVLTMLGLNNVGEILDRVTKQMEEDKAQGPLPVAAGIPNPDQFEKKLREATRLLREAAEGR